MTRSRKVEAAIKTDGQEELVVAGMDWTDHPIEEFTNEGSDAFCPFINNKRLANLITSRKGAGIIHRDYPVNLPIDYDVVNGNQKNKHYHWAQIGLKSVQCCKFQRDPVSRDNDLCEKHFRKCDVYKEHFKKR